MTHASDICRPFTARRFGDTRHRPALDRLRRALVRAALRWERRWAKAAARKAVSDGRRWPWP